MEMTNEQYTQGREDLIKLILQLILHSSSVTEAYEKVKDLLPKE